MNLFIAALAIAIAVATVDGKKAGDLQATAECKASKYNKYEAETHVKRCPPGWSRYRNEKCFKAMTTEPLVNHDGAQAACVELGSNLASISNSSEVTFIGSLVARDAVDEASLRSLWIGLRHKFGKLTLWYDLSESPIGVLPQDLTTPEGVLTECGSLQTDADTLTNNTLAFGKISMANCDELKGYVCQKYIINQGCGCSN